jgi:hypothetical protein
VIRRGRPRLQAELRPTPRRRAAGSAIRDQQQEDQHAVGDSPAGVGDVDDAQDALGEDEDERSGDRPAVATTSAVDRRTADNHSGDRAELVLIAAAEEARSGVAGEEDTDDRRTQA